MGSQYIPRLGDVLRLLKPLPDQSFLCMFPDKFKEESYYDNVASMLRNGMEAESSGQVELL